MPTTAETAWLLCCAPWKHTMCGYLVSFCTCVLVSLMLRYWSTECSVPVIAKSFFSSTVTCGAQGTHRHSCPAHQNCSTSCPTVVQGHTSRAHYAAYGSQAAAAVHRAIHRQVFADCLAGMQDSRTAVCRSHNTWSSRLAVTSTRLTSLPTSVLKYE